MSRDPRDWQKDMDFCDMAADGLDMEMGSLQVYTQYSDDPELRDTLVGQFLNEDDAVFMIEAREALPYWLNHVKQLKEDNARLTCQFTGAEQKYLTQSNTIAELRGRAERERKLKEAIEERLPGMLPVSRELMKRTLATLYPLDREDTE